ncbi:MAG: zf-HC2 domain-containing protein [Acidobacteriota bacterium]
MTAGVTMKDCPNDELLAAFIDGRLDGAARMAVVEHLADCAACRDAMLMADDLAAAQVVPQANKVVRGRFRSRMMPPLLAAAAVLCVVFLIPDVRDRLFDRTGMGALAKRASTIERRPTLARLGEDFDEYKPSPPRVRGANDKEDDFTRADVMEAQHELEARQQQGPLSARDLRRLGVTYLLTGDHPDQAVESLEKALMSTTGTTEIPRAIAACEDVGLLTDLVNAYLALKKKDAAFEVAQRAWSLDQSPVTAWNRALSLETRDPRGADQAWDAYLRLDTSSKWAQEARDRQDDLRSRLDLPRP